MYATLYIYFELYFTFCKGLYLGHTIAYKATHITCILRNFPYCLTRVSFKSYDDQSKFDSVLHVDNVDDL